MLKHHYPSLQLGIIAACIAISFIVERFLLPAALLVVLLLAARLVIYRGWIRTPVDWAVAGLVLMLPVSLWASALPEKTLLQGCRLVAGIGLYYAIIDWGKTVSRLKWLYLAVPIIALGLSLYGLVSTEWILDKLVFIPAAIYRFLPQMTADAVHPNVLAGSLVLLLPVILSMLVFAWGSLTTPVRLLALLSAALVTLMISLTQSRGAILAMACSLSLVVFLRWKRTRIFFLVLFVLAVAAMLIYGPAALIDPTNFSTESASKLDGRLEIWSRGIYMVQDFPLTGVGMGLYGEVADRLYPFFLNAPGSVPHAHNLFLQIAVDLGIPGLISWLAAFLVLCGVGVQLISKSRLLGQDHALLAAAGAGILGSQVALGVHGLLDATTWGMVKPAPLVWGLWGLACAAWIFAFNNQGESPQNPTVSHPAAESVEILGVRVGARTSRELIEEMVHCVHSGKRLIAAYVNIHAINLAQELPWFKDFLNHKALTYCDGFGVMLGARILGYRLPERYTPPDWLSRLCARWAEEGLSVAFLGARPGVTERAAQRLRAENPGLQVVYTHDGYFDRSPGSPENESVIQAINACNPDLLVVGMGMPAQERWLDENWERLNCRAALPVGAGFDYIAGEVPRAPLWMTDRGLEWLGRLWVEPGRLWKRYLIGIPRFLFHVILQRLQTPSGK